MLATMMVAGCVTMLVCGYAQPTFAAGKKKISIAELVKIGERTVVRVDVECASKGSDSWTPNGYGTGFFVDKEGHLVTNAHVAVDDAPWWASEPGSTGYGVDTGFDYRYVVRFENRDVGYDAVLVGRDPTDLAILQVLDIDPKDYDAIPIGDSDLVKKGDRAYVIGTPLGFLNTFTECVVNGVNRRETSRIYRWVQSHIQIRPRVGPGDSGGPLLNVYGEVVGVYGFGFEELIGLAIPINLLHKERLLASGGGLMPKGYFGAQYDVDRPLRTPSLRYLTDLQAKTGIRHQATLEMIRELAKDGGVVVGGTEAGSPSEEAGIKRGDVIQKFAGVDVYDGMDIRIAQSSIARDAPTIIVEVDRVKRENGKKLNVEHLSIPVTLTFP